jgi:hypothetical protein
MSQCKNRVAKTGTPQHQQATTSMMTNTMTCPHAMPAAPAPPRAALKHVNLLPTSFRCHCRTNENPHELHRLVLYGAVGIYQSQMWMGAYYLNGSLLPRARLIARSRAVPAGVAG